MKDSRACRLCRLPAEAKKQAERDLVLDVPYTRIAEKHGLHRTTVKLHDRRHMTERQKESIRAEIAHEHAIDTEKAKSGALQALRIDTGLAITKICGRLNSILDRADAEDLHKVSIAALKELRLNTELLVKMAGSCGDAPAGMVTVDDIRNVRAIVLRALAPHPEAQKQFIEDMREAGHAE